MNVLMWILFKKPESWPLFQKDGTTGKSNIDPLGSFRMFQKFMKDACMRKCILILIKYFQGLNAVFVKV